MSYRQTYPNENDSIYIDTLNYVTTDKWENISILKFHGCETLINVFNSINWKTPKIEILLYREVSFILYFIIKSKDYYETNILYNKILTIKLNNLNKLLIEKNLL